MGLKRAKSFTLLWPFLWSVQTLNDPCMRSFPKSFRSPWNNIRLKLAHIQKHTDLQIPYLFNMQTIVIHIMLCVLTSKPVMAIWCMESLTDLMISSIVARASSSSAVPSEFLLHFSISCKISGSRNVSEKTMSYFTCKMGKRYFFAWFKINKKSSPPWYTNKHMQQTGKRLTFNISWYLVILCTGFSRYASNESLWSNLFWHSYIQKSLKTLNIWKASFLLLGKDYCLAKK